MRKAVKELTLHHKQSITVEANTVAGYLDVPKLCSPGTSEDGDLRSRAPDRRSYRFRSFIDLRDDRGIVRIELEFSFRMRSSSRCSITGQAGPGRGGNCCCGCCAF